MNNTVQSHQAAKAHPQTEQIVQSLQTANVRTQTVRTVQPPKHTQTAAQNPVPRSTVAISESALELSAGYGFHEIRSLFREIFSFR